MERKAGTRQSPRLDWARIQRTLRRHLPELRKQYRVASLGVFGSYVRGEAHPRSDLDILVDTELPGLLEFIGLQNYLSDLLNAEIDLVPRQGLKPYIGKRIFEKVVWLQREGAPVSRSHRRGHNQKRRLAVAHQREYLGFLEDMVRAMDKIERFLAGVDFDHFTQNEEKGDAVTREIEIIGEAAKRIPSDVRRKYPAVP